MDNVAMILKDNEYRSIIIGGEKAAGTIAKNAGFHGARNFKIIDCGNFYRLFFEYEYIENNFVWR